MAFYPKIGKVQIDALPKTASTAISSYALLTPDGSGGHTPAASTTTRISGVSLRTVAATDSDYASNTLISVVVPDASTIFLADVYSGTALTTAMVGNQYDLYSSTQINVGGTSHKQVVIVGFVDSTHALVRITASYLFNNAASS